MKTTPLTNKGKLLVSTRMSSGRLAVMIILSVFMFAFALLFLVMFGTAKEGLEEAFGNSSVAMILMISLIFFLVLLPVICLIRTRSHCQVFENAVTGVTCLTMTSGMQKFELGYKDIMNVSEAGAILRIHTKYATFDVAATRNRAQALQEIRARMSGE